ncbi:MAG: inositol monophosphatase family protein [Pyrinomonadaceae bacterium]
MTIKADELDQLLGFAMRLASEAGEITLRYFRRLVDSTVERKRDGSFVTTADREAEAHLRRALQAEFPDDAILGEEEGEQAGRSGRRWIIDPIDGTFSFVHGVPFYGVLIGLEAGGEPQLGVVNIPALGEMAAAAHKRGCFWSQGAARVSTVDQLKEALLLATDFGACRQRGHQQLIDELEKCVSQRRTWGDCYGHLLVATGRAEIMLDPVMNIWDCAALLPIVEEAGGTFTDWAGNRTIAGGNAMSTNRSLFDPTMSLINKYAKQ